MGAVGSPFPSCRVCNRQPFIPVYTNSVSKASMVVAPLTSKGSGTAAMFLANSCLSVFRDDIPPPTLGKRN